MTSDSITLPSVNLVYILSDGRSGSTLLDLLLGSHPRVRGLGEMKQFHRYAGKGGKVKKCTCGEELSHCPLWGRVLEGLVHDYGIPLNDPHDFAERNTDLLRKTAAVAEVDWLCDSSKDPARLDLLLQTPGFKVEIIHLVRDPRAVAFSNARKRKRARSGKGFSLKHWLRYNYFKSMLHWKASNQLYREKYSGCSGYRLLKYEDLVDDYQAVCSQLWQSLGLADHRIQLSELAEDNHNIGGNHLRHHRVEKIERDHEYEWAISNPVWFISSWWISSALTLFGYSRKKAEKR